MKPATLFPVFFAIALLKIIVGWRLNNHLKRRHPAAWAALGSPPNFKVLSTFGDYRQSYRQLWLALKFTFSNAHRRLNDPYVSMLIWCDRFLTIPLYAAPVIAFFLLGVFR